jgi:hypothetical protein
MPSAVYAFASDTLIGVIRAHVLASQDRADNERTLLGAIGGLTLWALRFILAPSSTLSGFRGWVLEAAPVAPGRVAEVATSIVAALPAAPPSPGSAATSSRGAKEQSTAAGQGETEVDRRVKVWKSKTARFLALVQERYGDLAGIDLDKVSRIASELAPEVDLDPGSARRELRTRVLTVQGGAR